MTPYGIGIIVAAAAAGLALAAISAVVSMVWRLNAARVMLVAPAARARSLATLRLAPAAGAMVTGGIVLIAFLRLEPADAREVLGFVLPAAALATIAAFAWRAATAWRAWARTARAVASWSSQPGVVESEFPIVAVVGIWRPRLYVARTVVESCDRDELDAILAHERAHIRAHDNLMRLGFLCAPLVAPRTARELERAWTRASEEAADDVAARNEHAALALASALAKVARLAVGRPMPLLHASAIFSGRSVEERVKRLLDSGRAASTAPATWRFAIPITAAVAAICSPAGLRQIHNAAEFCVRHLP